jgi:hypothetical protein
MEPTKLQKLRKYCPFSQTKKTNFIILNEYLYPEKDVLFVSNIRQQIDKYLSLFNFE